MRAIAAGCVCVAALLLMGGALPVQAQGEEPIVWEVVSDSLQVRAFSAAGDSTIYLTGTDGTWVWRRSGPDRFVEVNRRRGPENLTMLSTGRLFSKSSGLSYSDDYLQTSTRVVDDGEVVIETPSGALVAAVDGRDAERSTDSGDTWTPQPNPVFDTVLGRGLALRPPTPELLFGRLVMVGLGGAAVSDDDGVTWHETSLSQFFGYDAESVVYSEVQGAFFTAMNGPVEDGGSSFGAIRKSVDGREWATVGRLPADERGFVAQLAAGQDGSLWGVLPGGRDTTAQGEVYRSVDGGASWVSVGAFDGEALSGDVLSIEDVVVDSEGRVWVGFKQGRPGTRKNGLIVRTVEPVAASGGSEEPGKPSEALLGTLYPNPTTGRVTVPLVLAQPAGVRVTVVDLLGREVAVLAEGRRAAGTYTLAFETAGWPAGIYVVRATVGGVTTTRRVTVVRPSR